MTKKKLLIITLILSIGSSFACINEYRTLLTGEVVYTDPSSGKVWNREIDTLKLINKSEELLAAYKRSDSLEYYSDYAATLTYLGEYQKAKKIYEEIEQIKPNLYTTASNLGTIYELMGKPDAALTWIKKSIELNPESHKGSEWIHIKILEYKLSKSANIKTSILGLDFGNSKIPTNLNNYDLEKLKDHIWHQLRERTAFVKPRNIIVGNLYFDLGNILAQIRDVEAALESYEAAREYGFESELMNDRISEFKSLAKKAERTEATIGFVKQNTMTVLFIAFGGFVLFIIFVIWIIKRKRKM
ncbi:tetratricopeptide repeat protein [Aureivirga sp. CE67]|uniref:tetratricopeptide repeat protein n=1 Tax=Aureivirga sp. CE67 TaxID=1788983 RepID=UPI0018CAFB25|nr:tetratricopeptide repeat protein [Aureivirga sp. CE67]